MLDRSSAVMTQLIMPNDTNHLGNLMGGNLMRWMDVCGAMAGMRHCEGPVVTVSVDHMTFKGPIKIGEIVSIEASVTRTFNTSFEVIIEVWAEGMGGEKRKVNEAFFTFVCIDPVSKAPRSAPDFVPQSDRQRELFLGAMRRRELRLIMGGKIKPSEAQDLKDIFLFED